MSEFSHQHYSIDLEDDDGWFHGKCFCGANLGIFPTAEDACDALMDHAFAAGVRAAQSARSPQGDRT